MGSTHKRLCCSRMTQWHQWWSTGSIGTKETSFHQTSLEEKPVAMGTRHWLVAVMPCSVGFTSVSHCIWALQKHYFPHPSMYRQVSSMVSLYKHTQNIVGGLTVMSEKCFIVICLLCWFLITPTTEKPLYFQDVLSLTMSGTRECRKKQLHGNIIKKTGHYSFLVDLKLCS